MVYSADLGVLAWAQAAHAEAERILTDPAQQRRHLRHGRTWFVGVDALPNTPDGGVGGVALGGEWRRDVPDLPLHPGQLSVIYPGYPRQDTDQSAANHSYRVDRAAAHVDGLLPVGPERRRFAREYHAYILGIPLNDVAASPTVVWPGSHRIMQAALREAIGTNPVAEVDVTAAYQAARRRVFNEIAPQEIRVVPGQAYLLHPFLLHGTAPWQGAGQSARKVVFFRPQFADAADWINLPAG